MHYMKNTLKSIIGWIIRLVLNIPSDFKVKQKWSSAGQFHFLVPVLLAAVVTFVKDKPIRSHYNSLYSLCR